MPGDTIASDSVVCNSTEEPVAVMAFWSNNTSEETAPPSVVIEIMMLLKVTLSMVVKGSVI